MVALIRAGTGARPYTPHPTPYTLMSNRTVYLDHAATTPLDPRVLEAMLPYLKEEFGNPSALYAIGRTAKDAVADARARIAARLGAHADEIVFTGSGTESDNLAVLGVARAHAAKGKHVITSAIEHHAVLHAAEQLGKDGWRTTLLPVDTFGMVRAEDLAAALAEDTTLVSLMLANNEIGTILPLKQYAKVVRDWKKAHGRGVLDAPFLHTDACQAAGALDLDVAKLGIDLLTINGGKIYGPKGVGALYVRRGVKLQPLVFGGGQEMRLRSGTENVAGIVGLAAALDIAQTEREHESLRLAALRDRLIAGIQERIPKTVLNGHATERLPNNVNMSVLDVEGEALLLYLDAAGISAATGSACDSVSLDPSHVVLAIGRPYEFAHSSMRFTLGRSTTDADIDYLLEHLPPIVAKLRAISPITVALDGTVTGSTSAFVGQGRPHWEK